jgi:hypothetical protein
MKQVCYRRAAQSISIVNFSISRRFNELKPSIGLFALAIALLAQSATASISTLNHSGNNGSGPFGTVSVLQGIDQNTVDVTVTLEPGEVFAKTGPSPKPIFAFNIDKTFTFVLPSGFSGYGRDGFPPFGDFTSVIACDFCGNGASPPQFSGPLSFSLISATGLTPSNFIPTKDGYYFAADIGVLDGTGKFNTFNVVSDGLVVNTAATPEPGSFLLLGTGLIAIAYTLKRMRQREPIPARIDGR